ncbi:MAG: hypothetical protein LBP59_01775 [Planctomycetaceae bacterium]|nr:hypothetical protein [Planctomycetaceae bacterium]
MFVFEIQLYIQIVLEFQRFKSAKACRPKSGQAAVNVNLSTNSLIYALYALKFNICV